MPIGRPDTTAYTDTIAEQAGEQEGATALQNKTLMKGYRRKLI
jgi:hypothetical protein